MGDVGIDLLKPKYPKGFIVPADSAYWEVLYDDGTVLCEAQGATYKQIDRSAFKSFRIIYNGEIVFEITIQPGATGHNFIYRRRTGLGQSGAGRQVVFIAGFTPMGPLFVIDLANGQYFEDLAGILPTLQLMPEEPDYLLPFSK